MQKSPSEAQTGHHAPELSPKPRPDAPLPPFPPDNLLFMDKSSDKMIRNGDILLQLGKKVLAFRGRPVLDIGCGYGRMAYALLRDGFAAPYLGIDILRHHVNWLRLNFSPAAPNFAFDHVDIKNDRYNPKGMLAADAFRLPDIDAPDAIFVLSVFTHMYERELLHYLDQIAAKMDRQSIAYCTFFLENPEMRHLEGQGGSQYPMLHRINDHCWYFNAKDPLHAISYNEDWLRARLLERGLHPVSVYYGLWCGRLNALSYQDTLFLARLT
jgi:SAM-dependent methyltransferase